jgi:hypothetical protein
MLGHHTACGHNRAAPDAGASEQNCTVTYPGVLFDDDRSERAPPRAVDGAGRLIESVISADKCHIARNEDVVADVARGGDVDMNPHEHISSDVNILSGAKERAPAADKARTRRAEHLCRNSL